jgi:energy-coupling factor transport system permease protein
MDAEIYLDRDTFIHRLDARTKIILFLLTFVAVLMFQDPVWMLPLAFLVFIQLAVSGSFKNMYRIRIILIVLTISSLVLWNLFSQGQTTLFWFIEVESLKYSIARTMLMILMISDGLILISTTRNEELVLGMIRLGLPYRVGFAISTSLRLVPTIDSSIMTISQAQRSRGLDLDSGNILQRVRKFIPLLIPVFISTIRSTNIFAMALESKGFGARENRTFYLELKMHAADYVLLVFSILFVTASIVCYAVGYGRLTGLTTF